MIYVITQGKNCETALNACIGNPCANGGTCQVTEEEDGYMYVNK